VWTVTAPVVNLAEVERVAKAATPGRWYPWWAYKKVPDEGNTICATAPGHQVRTDAPGGTHPSQYLEHIAACNPALVLRLIAALRDPRVMAQMTIAQYHDWLARHGLELGRAQEGAARDE
jgi:hypothetical protein